MDGGRYEMLNYMFYDYFGGKLFMVNDSFYSWTVYLMYMYVLHVSTL